MRSAPVASLALVLAGALTIAACGSGGTKTVVSQQTITAPAPEPPLTVPSTASQPTTPGPAPGPAAPSGPTVHRGIFSSPSHNIGCVLAGGTARCDIRKRDWSPPPHPASCSDQVDFGQGLTVGRSGRATFVCAGDTALNPTGPVIAYGSNSKVGDIVCASRISGMTCTNAATGHGFFIARDRYRLF